MRARPTMRPRFRFVRTSTGSRMRRRRRRRSGASACAVSSRRRCVSISSPPRRPTRTRTPTRRVSRSTLRRPQRCAHSRVASRSRRACSSTPRGHSCSRTRPRATTSCSAPRSRVARRSLRASSRWSGRASIICPCALPSFRMRRSRPGSRRCSRRSSTSRSISTRRSIACRNGRTCRRAIACSKASSCSRTIRSTTMRAASATPSLRCSSRPRRRTIR